MILTPGPWLVVQSPPTLLPQEGGGGTRSCVGAEGCSSVQQNQRRWGPPTDEVALAAPGHLAWKAERKLLFC